MAMLKVIVIGKVTVKDMVKENIKMKVKVMDEVKIQDKVNVKFKEFSIIGTIYYNQPMAFILHNNPIAP